MLTHYEVLGITPAATPVQVRRAYHERARQLHPDRFVGRPAPEVDAARRAMQDVNAAWRVLRDAPSRAAYDQELRAAPAARLGASRAPTEEEDDGWLDRPYPRRAAEPGDIGVAVVRAAPWVAVLVVLAIIFVFTAYARSGDSGDDLVGHCIVLEGASAREVDCAAPNDGRVVSVVDDRNLCTNGASARPAATDEWFCLVPA